MIVFSGSLPSLALSRRCRGQWLGPCRSRLRARVLLVADVNLGADSIGLVRRERPEYGVLALVAARLTNKEIVACRA